MLMLKNCLRIISSCQQTLDQIFNTANPFLEGHKITVTFDLLQNCMAKVTTRLHNLLGKDWLYEIIEYFLHISKINAIWVNIESMLTAKHASTAISFF